MGTCFTIFSTVYHTLLPAPKIVKQVPHALWQPTYVKPLTMPMFVSPSEELLACKEGSSCYLDADNCDVTAETAETQEFVPAGTTTACGEGSSCTVEANICDTTDEANFCVTPEELAEGGAASVAAMSAGIALAMVAAISVKL
jgi:hypothetical protein